MTGGFMGYFNLKSLGARHLEWQKSWLFSWYFSVRQSVILLCVNANSVISIFPIYIIYFYIHVYSAYCKLQLNVFWGYSAEQYCSGEHMNNSSFFSPEFKLLTTLSLKEAWGKVIFTHILLISAFKENFIIYIYQMYLF